mmetsp:Transcript_28501/g.37280  ORF Transcript_28501/g.37280 Transcript_28501/m.37280 type:complete len:600 (+) Transcript_28501:77-1876(+)|eukprot:CAMPEP_0117751254 /NCGR_PEP_ID=MMETSP0947-20121206/10860_1 /TAXON_ID=44440 /ORGANISM="Chattonella subsalsa, Strain CCMP2191" /LENGTH=599 /DNA_ID=CAMNT_0005569589 /DNA_START=53 /DNA_END=1852 /DNA_ORIENTATION=+
MSRFHIIQLIIGFHLLFFSQSSLGYEFGVPSSYMCDESLENTGRDFHYRGVNLGGFLVLEPWITPSLFYQFLGTDVRYGDAAKEKTGMDMYSFCNALGPEEGNTQLRRHWEAWVQQQDIQRIADAGLDSVRIPVGDWMFKPYGPYQGCTDGAVDELDRVLDLCDQHNVKAVLDIHGIIGSQNGFDNSGMASNFMWTSWTSVDPLGVATFMHWPIRGANWFGEWDATTQSYLNKNQTNINHLYEIVEIITTRYKDHPAVEGLELLNEPWQFTPLSDLQEIYWNCYNIIRDIQPNWLVLMHDAFRFDPTMWKGFMKNCPNVALDTHIYQGWMDPIPTAGYLEAACNEYDIIKQMETEAGIPVIVGEWSLAVDNCGMWLNGFNDNLPGYPKVQCDYVPCAEPYMGFDQPGTPLDESSPAQGPFGTGVSGPRFGMCPSSQIFSNDGLFFTNLAHAKLYAFENSGHGWFFWNFRTENEPTWSYWRAQMEGWIIPDARTIPEDPRVEQACTTTLQAALSDPFWNTFLIADDPDLKGIMNAPVFQGISSSEQPKRSHFPVTLFWSGISLLFLGLFLIATKFRHRVSQKYERAKLLKQSPNLQEETA